MAKKVQVVATLLALNLLFFTFANATGRPCPPGGGSGGGGSAVLLADPGAGGPGGGAVPVHDAEPQPPGHQPDLAHRPQPRPQQLRQERPLRLPVPQLSPAGPCMLHPPYLMHACMHDWLFEVPPRT
uniref:Uncharacterized protein n=1 Tax=Aegilops tauschii TaxID=37682 RepID=M8BC84_AEGTA